MQEEALFWFAIVNIFNTSKKCISHASKTTNVAKNSKTNTSTHIYMYGDTNVTVSTIAFSVNFVYNASSLIAGIRPS